MRPVGYLVNTEEGLEGEPGLFYNYITAGNGLFIRAGNPFVEATVLIGDAQVRGCAPLEDKVELPKGKIPKRLYDLALSNLCAEPYRERYLAVVWEGEYHLRVPHQDGSSYGVEYEPVPHTVLDIHSHATMHAFFSGTDNGDEQGLRLYMVVGKLNSLFPEAKLRVGVYGYFAPIRMEDIFV